MAPPGKKRRTSKLATATLNAFAADSSEEPDPVALAMGLKEQGQEHAAGGRFSEARAALGQAVRLLPGSSELHELHAQVLLELGCGWEAVRAAGRAVQLTPQWAEAHVTLARAQLNYGEPVLAETSYERALETLQPGADAEAVRAELMEAQRLAEQQRAMGPGLRAVVGGARGGAEGEADRAAAQEPDGGGGGGMGTSGSVGEHTTDARTGG